MKCGGCGRANPEQAKFCMSCSAPLRAPLEPGAHLASGRYEVKRRMDEGGMGAVYEVWDRNLDVVKALKEMTGTYDDEGQKSQAVVRFRNEAKLLAELIHPGVPRVSDFFEEAGGYYLVMDLIEGEDFLKIVRREGGPGLPEEHVNQTACRVLEILEFLHGRTPPILHRDLKPANIMRRSGDGRVMLIDFGIAKSVQMSTKKTGTFRIGTPAYMPPEQVVGRTDARSDIFSLGATMHHLLTGGAPSFDEPFAPVRSIVPGVSGIMESIVARALDENPANRFSSAKEMRQALKALHAASSRPPEPQGAAPARRSEPARPEPVGTAPVKSGGTGPAGATPGKAGAVKPAEPRLLIAPEKRLEFVALYVLLSAATLGLGCFGPAQWILMRRYGDAS